MPAYRIHKMPYFLCARCYFLAIHEWGEPSNPDIVVCVHGLLQNAHSFYFLAQHLASRYRVLCIDMPGRGQSDFLHYAQWYQLQNNIEVMRQFYGYFGILSHHYIGTSMGGLMAYIMCSQHQLFRKMVVNDVVPWCSASFCTMLRDRVIAHRFATRTKEEACALLLAEHCRDLPVVPGLRACVETLVGGSVTQNDQGRWIVHYDPKIVEFLGMLPTQMPDLDLWCFYEQLRVPLLLLCGQYSPLWTAEQLHRMRDYHPQLLTTVTVPGVGHPPLLCSDHELQTIAAFLAE